MQINDIQWWNEQFESGDWESGIDGKAQTRYFMELLLLHLPPEVSQDLAKANTTILDWGCALGQGVDVLTNAFAAAKVTGLDFAETACMKAKQLFPQYDFRSSPLGEGDFFDVIITSNVLEHYYDPFTLLKEHLKHAQKYYILLVPYNQMPHDCHFYRFGKDSFPITMDNFIKYFVKVIPSTGNPLWNDQQILVVYKLIAQ
ncbi:MAG TPA: methyltransferase domain-containing protein [Syntrophomonadaceae bacterium]|nr:methyltransferase domain-containing protein [Syntrophomonadaceae bacterium]